MNKQKILKRFRPYVPVILIYIIFVIIRFSLACLTTAYPTVGIDEFLYYSLGKSIATEGRLLYRGQPALYNYFIYPLFLSPIYFFFPDGSDFYRIIQCWNSILMNLAVFPIYGLNRAIFRNNRKALWISVAFLLLPDFSLNEFIFSEAIIYPFFFGLVFLIYLSLEKNNFLRLITIGIIGSVLYYTKPGAIVPAIVALLFFLIQGIIKKEKMEICHSLSGFGAFFGSFFLLWIVVHFAFGYKGTLLSVYSEQLITEGKMFWDVFLQTLICYPYYFCMACGIIPAIMIITQINKLDKINRTFYCIMLICLIILIIGTAWTVNRVEHVTVIFLRYIAMYIPIFSFGSIIPKESVSQDIKKDKISLSALILCFYLIICTAIWGSTIGIGGYIDNHFLISLSILVQPNITGTVNIVVFILSGLSIYLVSRRSGEKMKLILCCGIFVASTIINNICGYVATSSNAIPEFRKEAYNVQREIIKGEEYLYLFSSETKASDHGINIYSKHNNQELEWYDFFNNIHDHKGIYTPFVPVLERGMNEGEMTPNVNMIVAERTTYPLIKFSENMHGEITDNNSFYVGRFESGSRIVDAMIANMENFQLLQKDYGVLTIYREDWINQPIQIILFIESPVEQNIRFFSDNEHSWTTELKKGRYAYKFMIPEAAIGYNFVVDQADIKVYGFDIGEQE